MPIITGPFTQLTTPSWTQFKTYINGTSASFAYNWTENKQNTVYQIWTEAYVNVSYVFFMEKTASADLTDFESNWKNSPFRDQGKKHFVNTSGSGGGVGSSVTIVGPLNPSTQGVLVSTTQPDIVSAGTLGALNSSVELILSGTIGAGFRLNTGTLIGTLLPEVSLDNGTSWVTTGFLDIDSKGISDSLIFTAANTQQNKAVILSQGSTRARVRVSAYTSGTASATIVANQIPSMLIYNSPTDGRRATYSASTAVFVPAATATDIFMIQGSNTKTIRILLIELHASLTTAATQVVNLIKRSTANTGGTAVTTPKVPYDSTSAAATVTTQHYTANPTLGTAVSNVKTYRGLIPAVTTAVIQPMIRWDFGGPRPGSAVVLRNNTECLCLNLNGVTWTGGSITITVEWTEE